MGEALDEQPASDGRTVLLVVNRTAGRGINRETVKALAAELSQAGLRVGVVTKRRQLQRLAAEAHRRDNIRSIVVVGGDGTVAEVVNQLPGVPLAIMPLGTENLLARYLEVRRCPRQVVETVLGGRVRWLDLGRANSRRFVLMAGVGFDAEVVHRVHEARSGGLVRADYCEPIVAALRNYRYPEVRIRVDEGGETLRGRIAFVFNLPCYGLGLPLAPQARGDDGLLDLCLFERGSSRDLARYLWAVVRGAHAGLSDVRVVRAARFRVESDRSVPVQLDGDPFGWLPIELTVRRRALPVIVPADRGSEAGETDRGETRQEVPCPTIR